jgi:hydrogenase 3 maturation protease
MGLLRQTLARQNKDGRPPRLAFLGIGQELNGDDGIGPFVVRALQAALPEALDLILCIDAGPSPENFTGALRKFAPNLVVIIDAAGMGQPAGSIQCLDWRLAEGFSASGHTLPLTMVAGFLEAELGCEVLLVGVQPGSTEFGAPLSSPVQEAGRQLIHRLISLFYRSDTENWQLAPDS